jgi:hypothetical protein
MNEKGDMTYTFELKDLSYKELFDVYKSMDEFVSFLIKSRDNAEVVKDEEDTKEEEKEES